MKEENKEEVLQEDSVSGPFLEHSDTYFTNDFHRNLNHHLKDDESSRRIKETIHAHQVQEHLSSNQTIETPDETTIQNSNNLESVAGMAAATGLKAVGVPAPVADLAGTVIAKKITKKTVPQKILEFIGFPESITSNPVFSYLTFYGVIVLVISLLLFSVLLLNNGRGTRGKKEASNYLAYGYVDNEGYKQGLTDYLKQSGFCKNTLDCMESTAYRFYKTFRDKIEQKQEEYEKLNKENNCTELITNPITLTFNEDQTMLLISTIFYHRSDDELLSSEEVSALKFLQYQQEMDYLIEAMYGKINEEGTSRENTCYEISTDSYKDKIVQWNGYIDRFRSDLGTNLSNEKKLDIYNEILSEKDAYSGVESFNDGIVGKYKECSGVTVVNKQKDIIGTYSLEDYVAGVLSGEMYSDFPMESQKALAVAARTYVLSRTNSCTKSIESSSDRQNFNENIQDFAREATNATAGQVLVDRNGNIFSTEYDSWSCKGQTTCTYTKKPNGETHVVTISDKYLKRANGGHGRGMSQIAAADMAYQGKNYQEILFYFYSDGVKITNLTKNTGFSGGKYSSNAPIHADTNGLWNSSFYNKQAANLGQCVWYARSRAQEILYYSNMPESMKNMAIDSIKHTYGNGEAWFRNPNGNIFAKSTDVNQPRAGAIVSWSGGLNRCTPSCGHVAIIESVNSDGTVTISEGWKAGDWSSNAWSTVRYRKFNATIDYIKSHTNSNGDRYYFNGYVYLLG